VRRGSRGCAQLFFVVAGLALTVAQPLDAMSFALSPAERDEAVRLGRRSTVATEFGTEWRVAGDAPGQSLVVMTPFHRLALAARNSAFKGEDMSPRDVDSLVRDQEGRLVLWATVRGSKPDFARFYVPRLYRGEVEIKPSFAQNERTALREEDGTYVARNMYVFPAAGLDGKGRVTLVVKNAESAQVARFNVDLSAMR
jgi:hypothetical protein